MSHTRWTSPHPSSLTRIFVALFLVLPLVGASAYMWAMWDPKVYLRNIPLAVVSEDAGVHEGAEFNNYGDQIAEGMLALDYLNFHRETPEGASNKLERGEYMMVVSIPRDFSAKAATIIDAQPTKPEIHFELNDHYGTQGAVITGSLIPELQASVSQAVTAEYSTKVIKGLNEMSKGLRDASNGASQIDDGAGQLRNGGAEAVNGIGQLKDGSFQVRDGAGQLRDGAGELSKGMDDLRDGTGQLADGAGQIKDGVKELTDMLIPMLSQGQGSVTNLRPVLPLLRTAGMHAEANELEGLINDLDPNNPNNLVVQLGQLRDGTAELHRNLSDPNAPYLNGVIQLQDGAHQLRDGSRQLADGTVQLDDGMGELNVGAGQLKDGMDQLKDGTNQLSTGLADGVRQAPTIAQPDVSSANMATPITFTQGNLNPVQTAMSEEDPTATKITGGVSILLIVLFAFLAMAVLAIALPAIIRRRRARRAAHRAGPAVQATAAQGVEANAAARVTEAHQEEVERARLANSEALSHYRYRSTGSVLAAFALLFLASLLSTAALATAAVKLGWQPPQWGPALLTLLLIAGAGAAVFHFFRTAFTPWAGSALVVATFVIGLFASGAIWPSDATPAPLRLLHLLHPMGYARDAFTRSTTGIYDSVFIRGIFGLLLFLVVGVVASIVVHRFQTRHFARRQSAAISGPSTDDSDLYED